MTSTPSPQDAGAAQERERRLPHGRGGGRGKHLRLVSDFQPDANAIEERPHPTLATATVYLLLALIAVVVAWACLSRVDRIVVAPGKLVTTKPNIVVQPLETSVIKSIEVAPGDVVRAGQVLARLDPTFSQSDVDQLREKVKSLGARIERLEAELSGTAFDASADSDASKLLEAKLYLQRKSGFEAQKEGLLNAQAKAEAGLATTKTEIPLLEQRITAIRSIEDMRSELYDRKTGSRLNLLLSQNQRLELETNLARSKGNLVEQQHAANKARSDLAAYNDDFRKQVLEDLIKARDERTAATEQIKKAQLRKELVAMTSPVDAVVLAVAERSIGSVLREAEPLITLVPADVPLEAEALVAARDIGLVEPGQTVRLKFDTFPFQRYGTAKGVLRTISRDAFPGESKADNQTASQAHYRARVEIVELNLRGVPDTYRLQPGMTLSGEIKIGDRSIISYFLYPILRGFDESIREP